MKPQLKLLKAFYNNPTTELYNQFEYNNDALERILLNIKYEHHRAKLFNALKNSPVSEKIIEIINQIPKRELWNLQSDDYKREIEKYLAQYDGPWDTALGTSFGLTPDMEKGTIIINLHNDEASVRFYYCLPRNEGFFETLDKDIAESTRSKEYQYDYIRRRLTGKLTEQEKRLAKRTKPSKWEEKLGARRIKKASKGKVLQDFTDHKRYELTDKQWDKYNKLLDRKDKWSDEKHKCEYGTAEYKRAERNYRKAIADRAELLCAIIGIN